jgi:hypothetical protein
VLQRVIILFRADRGSGVVDLRSGANAGSSGVLRKRSEALQKLQESQGQSLVTKRVQFVPLESWRFYQAARRSQA